MTRSRLYLLSIFTTDIFSRQLLTKQCKMHGSRFPAFVRSRNNFVFAGELRVWDPFSVTLICKFDKFEFSKGEGSGPSWPPPPDPHVNKGTIFSRNYSTLFLNIHKYNFYKPIKRTELHSKAYDNRSALHLWTFWKKNHCSLGKQMTEISTCRPVVACLLIYNPQQLYLGNYEFR